MGVARRSDEMNDCKGHCPHTRGGGGGYRVAAIPVRRAGVRAHLNHGDSIQPLARERPVLKGVDVLDPLRLWGKLGPNGAFHPAIYHMLDVGHVARTLLQPDAALRFRTILAQALGAHDPMELLTWLPLLVAIHDIGKISAPFQGQETKPRTRAERERLALEGFTFGRLRGQSYPHQQVGAVFTETTWPELESGTSGLLVLALRDAIGGHHGRFALASSLKRVRDYCTCEEPTLWADLRASTYTMLREQLAPSGIKDLPAPRHRTAATMALAGFTILCDWLGSDSGSFPLEPSLPLPEYAALSRERANEAISRIGFAPARSQMTYHSFGKLFPAIEDVRPLQHAIDEIPLSAITWPSLFVIEAPTGEGKTEAALALAARMAAAGPSDELYFALPTTATSNQMFGRVQRFVDSIVGEDTPVKLIHGQAFLVTDDLLLHMHDDARDDGAYATEAPDWFAPKKRALLAPFGVGTVDQVELAVLNARHYMLRLFGLAGKVVIIDEIHAYDTYMSTILEQALRWLATLGSTVILLSATLPTKRHAALARCFREAAESWQIDDDTGDDASMLPYPCVAGYAPRKTFLLSPPAAQLEKPLRVEFVDDATLRDQTERLLDLAKAGGAICRICTTVGEAQDLFRAVDDLAPANVRRLLIHSRFPAEDRRILEEQITALFGPASQRTIHERAIVISTQVLEQSLDLDFDALITDMAPTDLLLQRAGRLHRHQRARPAGHGDRVLRIQLGRTADGLPEFGTAKKVYDPFVLWKSWLTLDARATGDGRAELTLPGDYRPLIEETYDNDVSLATESPLIREKVQAAYTKHCNDQMHETGEARLRLAPDPRPDAGIADGRNLEFTEDADGAGQGWGIAKTRWGADSITAIPVYRQGTMVTLYPEDSEGLGPSCDRACQLRLLQRSIPVSHQVLVPKLRDSQLSAPGWFRNASLLRNTAILFLDEGCARYGDLTVFLDPKLGLVIRKERQG